MYRQTRLPFVTGVLTAAHSSPPERRKKCGKESPDCHMTVFSIHFFELSWACLSPRKQPIRWTGGQSSSHKWLVSHQIWSVEELEILSDRTELRMSLSQLPGGEAQEEAIDNLSWKTRKVIINPFTAPACKMSAPEKCKRYIFRSYNKSNFSIACFDENPFTC